MSTPFLFIPIFRAFDSAGDPLAGGLLYTYEAGSTTPLATYSDAAGVTPNANPVVLDTTGSATVRLGTAAYKFVLKDSGGSTQWTEDNYTGIADAPTLTALTVSGDSELDTLTVSGASVLATVTATSVSAPGVALTAVKSADLNRASTQTFANDPDLTLTLAAGTYQVDLTLFFGCTTTTTQGFKAQLSGTATASGKGAAQAYGNGSFASLGAVNTYNNALYGGQADLTGTTDYLKFSGTLVVTVGGTLVLQWAQNSATGQTNNTTLFAGSSLKVTPLA